jgi:hypothetical protein
MEDYRSERDQRMLADDLEAKFVNQSTELLRKDDFIKRQQETIRQLALKISKSGERSDIGSPVTPAPSSPAEARRRGSQRKQARPIESDTPARSALKKKSDKSTASPSSHDRPRHASYSSHLCPECRDLRAGHNALLSEFTLLRSKLMAVRERNSGLRNELQDYSHAAAENSELVERLSAAREKDFAAIDRLKQQVKQLEQLASHSPSNEDINIGEPTQPRQSLSICLQISGFEKMPGRVETSECHNANRRDDEPSAPEVQRLRDELLAVVKENGVMSKRNSELEAVFSELGDEINVMASLVKSFRFDPDDDSHTFQDTAFTASSDFSLREPFAHLMTARSLSDDTRESSYSVLGETTGASPQLRHEASFDALLSQLRQARHDIAVRYGTWLALTAHDNSAHDAARLRSPVHCSSDSSCSTVDLSSGFDDSTVNDNA